MRCRPGWAGGCSCPAGPPPSPTPTRFSFAGKLGFSASIRVGSPRREKRPPEAPPTRSRSARLPCPCLLLSSSSNGANPHPRQNPRPGPARPRLSRGLRPLRPPCPCQAVAAAAGPLTRLSLCSVRVQASMKVCAMTDSEASTTSWTCTSKMKWGFLRMFTQNRSGKLRQRDSGERPGTSGGRGRGRAEGPHLLVFQMWMVSSSLMSCLSACSSRKSKKYFTAGGTARPGASTLWKKLSTNCCSVPCGGRGGLSALPAHCPPPARPLPARRPPAAHLDREQAGQVDLRDGLGALLLLHAAALGLALLHLVRRPHQVPHAVLVLQKGVACGGAHTEGRHWSVGPQRAPAGGR